MTASFLSSAPALRQPAARHAEPSAAVVAANVNANIAPFFVGELQRLAAAIALPLPLPLALTGLSLPAPTEPASMESDESPSSEPADPSASSELLLPAMLLPELLLPAMLLSMPAVSTTPMVTETHASSPLTLKLAAERPAPPASPVLLGVPAPIEATVAGSAGPNQAAVAKEISAAASPARVPPAFVLPAVGPNATLAHASATSNQPATTQPARAELSPEASVMRERSLSNSNNVSAPVTDGLVQAPSPAPGDTSMAQPSSVHASGSATRPRQALVDALGERIEWQLKSGSERAVIRLDPPMQGQLEITIHRDAGTIQVHLSATHGDVVKQLQAISDTLRQELTGRQTGDVVVVVSHAPTTGRDSDGRGRQPGQTPEQTEPGEALAEAETGQTRTRFALATSS